MTSAGSDLLVSKMFCSATSAHPEVTSDRVHNSSFTLEVKLQLDLLRQLIDLPTQLDQADCWQCNAMCMACRS